MVPGSIDEVTEAWLARHLGPVWLERLVDVGSEFGFAGVTVRVTGRLASSARFDLAIKLGTARRAAREAWFYERCAPSTPIALPAFGFGDLDVPSDRGAVALDFLDGVVQGDVITGTTDERLFDLVRTLARLHCRWWGADAATLDEIRREGRPPARVREGRLAAVFERFQGDLDPRRRTLLEAVARDVSSADAHLRRGPRTLIHGDVHLDNTLFGKAATYLLDWEGARIGTPAEDLVRIVVEQGSAGRLPIDRVAATYLEECRSLGAGTDTELAARMRSALTALRAGVINWLGAPGRSSEGSRRRTVARASFFNVLIE